MKPGDAEDEFTFARRRADEGTKPKQIITELAERGVNADLAESIVNGVMSERPGGGGGRFSWLEIGAGALLVIVGLGFFYVRATQASNGENVGFRLPIGFCVVGAGLLARGLFR